MIFNTVSRSLYTDEGEYIKQISCPLASRLARSVSAAEPDREFNCMECETKVKNLAYLSDEQALVAAKDDPDVCFFATRAASNVVHITAPLPMHSVVWSTKRAKARLEPSRLVIRTARTIDEMNFAAANGFKLLLRRAGSGDGVRLQLAVYQDSETGCFVSTNDVRWPPGALQGGNNTFSPILDYFKYTPAGPASPVAAYVVPPELSIGTEVFVEDAIEDLICDMPQDTAERMSGWWAIWDGEDLRYLPHPTGGFLG